MANVITFKANVEELDNKIWREIEMSSLSTLADLAYVILYTFETTGSHLFRIEYKGNSYEFIYDTDELKFYEDKAPIPPNDVTLEELDLQEKAELNMVYDYGNNWEFTITVEKIKPMESRTSCRYPYIVDGRGKGIVDDMFVDEVKELMDHIDEENKPGLVASLFKPPYKWDYRDFLLGKTNVNLKKQVKIYKKGYEGE